MLLKHSRRGISPQPALSALPQATGGDPRASQHLRTPSWVNPQDNKVYCANYIGSSVTVIDGAPDSVVKTIAVGTEPGALTCNPVQNRIYVATGGSCSVSVIRDSALVEAEERAPSVQHRLALEVYPNPFNGQVRLRLSTRAGTEACPYRPDVRIYDVNGALVRNLNVTRPLAPSLSRSLLWNGTDATGRRVPAGISVVRLTDGACSVNRKVMLLR